MDTFLRDAAAVRIPELECTRQQNVAIRTAIKILEDERGEEGSNYSEALMQRMQQELQASNMLLATMTQEFHTGGEGGELI